MKQTESRALAELFLDAWNSQDAERVVACYTKDLVYRDPNTRGDVEGAEAMRHYLGKLFAAWTMRWTFREAFSLAVEEGTALLWHANIQRPDGDSAVELDGMDLVLLRDGLIARNEVYFDRLALRPLLEG